jgi:hypothetical protein
MNEQKKKRIIRGRRPGVPLKDYDKNQPYNERPNLRRFSVSVPAEMDRVIRSIRAQCDIEFAKIFRSGLDEFVNMNSDKITAETRREYWRIRRQVDDTDWGKD